MKIHRIAFAQMFAMLLTPCLLIGQTKDQFCRQYANDAVAEQQQNLAQKCGFQGPEWDASVQHHFPWCMGANQSSVEPQRQARIAALARCSRCTNYANDAVRANQQNLASHCGLSGPPWNSSFQAHFLWCMKADEPSVRNQFELRANALNRCSRCNDYANDAVQANQQNINRSCGFSGPRWSSLPQAHFPWCMAANQSSVDAERNARHDDLANHCTVHVIETMTDRCSGDVIIASRYTDDFTDALRAGVLLKRGGSPPAPGSSRLPIKGHTWIRWWCHSTTGNWADPGTWRLKDGRLEAGCQFEETTGSVGDCKGTNVTLDIGSSDMQGWTPERSRCSSDGTQFIDGALGQDRLLQIRCWGK